MRSVAFSVLVLAVLPGCYCSHRADRYTYRDPDAGVDSGQIPIDSGRADGGPDATVRDGGDDASCTAPLGTLENCAACGDRCGWVCGAEGCNDAVALALSDFHTCAARQDGSVVCWGLNPGGHLGDGTLEGRTTPAQVLDLDGAELLGAGWGVGDFHTCAVMADASVQCWGANLFGQVGDGTTADRPSPVTVVGLSGATSVDAGGFRTCAVVGESVRCWGESYGSTAVEVPGLSGVTAVSVGQGHACALSSGGRVHCWGRNDRGQLGDGTTIERDVPVAVGGLSDPIAVSAGGLQTCAINRSGSVRCWGGDYGASPVAVAGIAVATAITVGQSHACAIIEEDDSVRCWGTNERGQLGDGSTTDSLSPVVALGLSGAAAVVAGGHHTCALIGGGVRCWGANEAGQLGDGTTVMRTAPVAVVPPE